MTSWQVPAISVHRAVAIPEIAGYKQLSQLLVTQPIPTSIVHVQIDSDAQVLGEIPPYREESMVPGPYTQGWSTRFWEDNGGRKLPTRFLSCEVARPETVKSEDEPPRYGSETKFQLLQQDVEKCWEDIQCFQTFVGLICTSNTLFLCRVRQPTRVMRAAKLWRCWIIGLIRRV